MFLECIFKDMAKTPSDADAAHSEGGEEETGRLRTATLIALVWLPLAVGGLLLGFGILLELISKEGSNVERSD